MLESASSVTESETESDTESETESKTESETDAELANIGEAGHSNNDSEGERQGNGQGDVKVLLTGKPRIARKQKLDEVCVRTYRT